MWMLQLVSAVVVVLLAWVLQRGRKSQKFPPGPYRFPLVGSLLGLALDSSKYPYETFNKLHRKYGPVSFLRNGTVDMAVINGYEATKKALTGEEWLERLDDKKLLMRVYDKRQGLIYGNLNLWRASRRFTVRNLREYGFGKMNSMETCVNREIDSIQAYLTRIVERDYGYFEPLRFFDVAGLNIVWALVTGTRFSHDDPQVKELVDGIMDFNHAFGFGGGFLQYYPILHEIFPRSWLGLGKLERSMRKFRNHMEDLLQVHRQKGTYRQNPENFVEVYLQHIDEAKAGHIPDPHNIFTDENLVCVLYDMFWAGCDTTPSTICFAILWLTLNPTAQRKLRNELHQFIDANKRLPSVMDKNSLPYTRATLLEIGRRSTLIPLSPRKVYVDTSFDDYVIPSGSIVMLNYHSVMMDKEFWGDPENFRPERFLDSHGDIINSQSERVIPFGLGKRNCLGESVAECSTFLFLTFLFSHYEYLPLSTSTTYDTDPDFGIVMAPKSFAVRIKRCQISL